MFRKYPSLTLLGTVIGGIIVADLIHPPLSLLVSGALLFVIGGYLCYRYSRASIGAILFALSLAAIAAVQFAHATYQLPPSHYSKAADPRQTVQIYGKVADWPELKTERTELIISVDSLGGKVAQRATGRLLLKISDTTTALQRGDRVEFYGRIYHIEETPGSERFDYGRYLNLKGIFGTVYLPSVLDIRVNRRADLSFFAIVDRLRDHIRRVLQSNLSPETAALASGFLIGETRDIPVEVYRMFRDSGTLHLMAVSGSNVAVVLGFFYLLLKPFPLGRVQRSIALLLVVVVFAALSYGDPSGDHGAVDPAPLQLE
jgi:predicted membrane metal-binding protein